MAWCEQNRVDFVFGLARNARLVADIAVELLQAEAEAVATGKPARRFKDFRYHLFLLCHKLALWQQGQRGSRRAMLRANLMRRLAIDAVT